MGLDTVELVYNFERYFSLDIPDPICEAIHRVGEMSAYISQRLGVTGLRHSAARDLMQRQLSELLKLPPGAFDEGSTTTIQQLLPDADAVARFRQVASSCGLALPQPRDKAWQASEGPSFLEKLLGITPTPSPTPWHKQSLAALVDWAVSANYEQLVPRPPASEYEVERAVVGITSTSSGVPVEEIELSSSFTNDLGMD